MRVSSINSYSYLSSIRTSVATNSSNGSPVGFKGIKGKVFGGALGGLAGGAAGGAIIGGGSLAGMAALSILGPVGIGLGALYTIGGALVGGYLGSGVADAIEGDDKPNNHKK